MSKTSHRTLVASTLAATSLLLSACGGGGGGSGEAGADEEAVDIGPADVTIVNFAYEDPEFTAAAGDTVTWVNEGAAPHTVTGDDFNSGIIRNGGGFQHTFEDAGTYEYWCTNHEGMTGTIVVE
jgi:plastocyanin